MRMTIEKIKIATDGWEEATSMKFAISFLKDLLLNKKSKRNSKKLNRF